MTIDWALPAMACRFRDQIDVRAVGQIESPLGDVRRQVADPLQVVVDLQHGDHEPQVGRHRLVQCQRLQALLFHLDFEPVDFVVGLDDFGRQFPIAIHHASTALAIASSTQVPM